MRLWHILNHICSFHNFRFQNIFRIKIISPNGNEFRCFCIRFLLLILCISCHTFFSLSLNGTKIHEYQIWITHYENEQSTWLLAWGIPVADNFEYHLIFHSVFKKKENVYVIGLLKDCNEHWNFIEYSIVPLWLSSKWCLVVIAIWFDSYLASSVSKFKIFRQKVIVSQ